MEANTSTNQRGSDEIDLFELADQLWREKLLIILITTAFTLIGASYTFLSTPIFKSSAVITPPTPGSLIEIKKIQTLLEQLIHSSEEVSPDTIFDQFLHNLNSNRYKERFLSRTEIQEYFRSENMTQLQARQSFNKAMTIQTPKKKPYQEITLSLQTNSPELSSRWLNEYILYAEDRFISEMSENIHSQISAAKNNLLLNIQSKKANYHLNLNEEIKRQEEALAIAEEIGLHNPLKTETIFYKPEVLDQMRSAYRLGTKSLKAELNALKARAKEIDRTPGLSEEKLKLELLSSIKLNTKSISPMTLDLVAEPDSNPVKPKRLLIITLSVLLGGIAGIITALVRIAIRNRRS